MAGETWNVLKIGYQLKQVRERLAKGLVDKGVLRTEKRNFLLFDMATHPVADLRVKDAVVSRVVALLTASTSAVPSTAFEAPGTQMRALRAVSLACSAYAASVLDNAFAKLGYEEREIAFARCDDILAEFAAWPFGSSTSSSTGSKKREGPRIAMGSSGSNGREAVLGLLGEVHKELVGGDEDTGCELVAGVLEVLSKLDSLL
jgi:golgi phosphoprotein 3